MSRPTRVLVACAVLAAAFLGARVSGGMAVRAHPSPPAAASGAAPTATATARASLPPRGGWGLPGPAADSLCADCHPALVATYRASGMAHALEPVRAGELEGLSPVAESATGLVYRFEQSGERARIVETAPPDERGLPHRDSASLAFAVGAGDLDRSYAALRHGRLWFAPLEIVSAHGDRPRHAALAPQHQMIPGLRFGVPITPECLGCHTDVLPPRDFPLNLAPAGDAWSPRGISCRACHAGAAEHVEWREADLAGETPNGPDPVLAPGSLGRVERMSLCAGCHLQGDARIELDPGRFMPPPPGGDLLARRAVFVAAEPTNEVAFVSHVERLVLSRCYLESTQLPGGGLTCQSCHDPHVSVHEPRERERVRAACTTCHPRASHSSGAAAAGCSLGDAEAKRGRDCAACHLPRTSVFDVAGVEIHDHWIRTRPEPPGEAGPLRFPESPTGDWRRFTWPDAEPPSHLDDPGLWTMAFYSGGHFDRALELVDRPPGSASLALPMFHHVRGVLLSGAGRHEEARRAYERALELDPALGEAAVNLGLLLGRLGRADEGLAVLDRLLERHPRSDGAFRNRALLRASLGDVEGTLADLEAAQRLLPDAALARALADACQQAGRPAEARRWADEARRLDPIGARRGQARESGPGQGRDGR